MALFHPWMLKSPVGAAWIDVRDSISEQIDRLNHVKLGLIFVEAAMLPRLYSFSVMLFYSCFYLNRLTGS